jgi:hypothetical protein
MRNYLNQILKGKEKRKMIGKCAMVTHHAPMNAKAMVP